MHFFLYTTRGNDPDMEICEEFSYIKEGYFYRVILPPAVTGTIILAILTLGREGNFVERLIEKRNSKTGKPIFKVVRKTLVCDSCRRKGNALECVHMMADLPYWHDPDRYDDVKALMEDDEEDFLRETKGVQSNSQMKPAFHQALIQNLYSESSIYKEDSFCKHVFVTVDPACGGKRSRYAITSSLYINGKMVVRIDDLFHSFHILQFRYGHIHVILCVLY